jgi:tRNA A-37 threonylcarbamoyl transferase component Bud32
VGSYRLVRQIAEGGMGQVYEVQHVELGRRAALKVLRPELAQNEETAARFFTEARAMTMAQHPGLVHVYEYGHLDDGGAYLVMELVQGETLRTYLEHQGGRLKAVDALILSRQIAAALHAAHEKGVTHRDLKPENIGMVHGDSTSEESRIKVFDFGLAKVVSTGIDATAAQTRPGQMLGTPLYMSPEQAGAPGGVGPHSDVYALGVMLFEMLAGRPPFVADSPMQLIAQHLFAEPPRLSSLLPDCDPDLDPLLQRMLAKSPGARPSMREVKTQLRQALDKNWVGGRTQPAIAATGFRAAAAAAPTDETQADEQPETIRLKRYDVEMLGLSKAGPHEHRDQGVTAPVRWLGLALLLLLALGAWLVSRGRLRETPSADGSRRLGEALPAPPSGPGAGAPPAMDTGKTPGESPRPGAATDAEPPASGPAKRRPTRSPPKPAPKSPPLPTPAKPPSQLLPLSRDVRIVD